VPTGAVVSASLNGGRPAWPGGVGAPVIGRENRCFVVVDKIGGGFRELAERRAKTTRAAPRHVYMLPPTTSYHAVLITAIALL